MLELLQSIEYSDLKTRLHSAVCSGIWYLTARLCSAKRALKISFRLPHINIFADRTREGINKTSLSMPSDTLIKKHFYIACSKYYFTPEEEEHSLQFLNAWCSRISSES